jgi:hypothetical protein
MSFIWLLWHNGTGHTRGLFALPFWLESHLPFPGHYIIICVEICLRCRIEQAHFPPNKQTKKESNPNQIQSKKERAWYYYYIHTEPIKIKKTFPNQKKHTNFLCGMARVAVPSARAGGGKGPGRRRCPPGARRACRIPYNRTAVNWIHIHKKSRS